MDLDYVNMNNFPDAEIVARMRKCNYEKFKTLVRMHLSFELDLNTDEFDFPYHEIVYEDKGKLRKWNRMPKKHKHATSTGCASASKGSTSAGNSPTEGLHQQIDSGFLFHLIELKDFLLLEKNLTQEGIFRKTGSVSRQNELRLQLRNEKALDLEGGGYSAHDCATIFKGYLADLPEPLLTDAHYPAHLQIAPLCMGTTLNILAPSTSTKPPNSERLKREQHLLNSVQLLLLLLPDDNRKLLQHIIEMLHAVANHEDSNKMSPENLATLFAPHLICPRNMPPEALHYVSKKMSSIIAYMITKGSHIFLVPSKVATDIRAYFLEQKRKKTMSPEHTLDESISDMSTVNTVYTFVDREKTAAAHTANTTDTELAQLYAHIQSLPESSKKRRLIKQFNKQNGQGTPLQLVLRNRLKNSEASRGAKSIGDSIKKHIFHKGIMLRTPKRSNGAPVLAGIETPIFANNKNPKMRVLFQSPTPASNVTSVAAAPVPNFTNASNSQYAIKMHPLQKSISSSSLLNSTSSSSNLSHHNQDIESSSSNSSDGYTKPSSSSSHSNGTSSAPVSRQTSSELAANSFSVECNTPTPLLDPAYCTVTPLNIGPENTKKNVAWHRDDLLKINEISTSCTSPTQQSSADLMSRYKSEPNLSHLIKDKLNDVAATPVSKGGKSAFTRKIMKGVSMGNLKFPFSTPESTKRLVRSVSTTLKRRSSDDTQRYLDDVDETNAHVLEDVDVVDLDDHTFEDDPLDSDDDQEDEEEAFGHITRGGSSSNELPGCSKSMYQQLLLQQGSLYRNLDLITSTPSLLLGRRSMSPITKSTQRMPKAMQESIMTPRSRKPVMVLATALGSSEQNQTVYPTDLSSFREQDEEDSLSGKPDHGPHANILHENANSLGGFSDVFRRRQQLLNANQSFVQESAENTHSEKSEDALGAHDPLTNDFKEYLLSRSVLTASPVDSSFSSQPDDFGSTQDIEDLDESQLSPSLLYCLDGNQPGNGESKSEESSDGASGSTRVEAPIVSEIDDSITPNGCLTTNRLSTNPFVILNNARKRAATSNGDKCTTSNETTTTSIKSTSSTNKENCENVDGYRLSKKFLISEYPGETSF